MKPRHHTYEKQGFTLMELSIVIGIIAMITSGILIGSTMDKAAKINQAVALHAQFTTAWNSFRATYNALPGDMPNATKYWGTDDQCPTLPGTATNSGTCNGNGDGKIAWYSAAQGSTIPALSGSEAEGRLVFQHLALSGFLQMPYSAVTETDKSEMPPYVIPKFRMQYRASWFVGSTWAGYADLYPSAGIYGGSAIPGNALQTAVNIVSGTMPIAAVANAAMVKAIDVKMDDGYPRNGKFQASNALAYTTGAPDPADLLTCITDDGSGTYIYYVRNTTDSCRFLMSLDQ